MFVIAEVGNNHLGKFDRAIDYIDVYSDMGADAIKFQFSNIAPANGSMTQSFYYDCMMEVDRYRDLIHYGKLKGIKVFNSYFYDTINFGIKQLIAEEPIHKLSASQFYSSDRIIEERNIDRSKTIISTNQYESIESDYSRFKNLLFATDYMCSEIDDSDIEMFLDKFEQFGNLGLSCHCIDYNETIRVMQSNDALECLEKHVSFSEIKYYGKVFRDSVHGSKPSEFYKICKSIK